MAAAEDVLADICDYDTKRSGSGYGKVRHITRDARALHDFWCAEADDSNPTTFWN